jgi:hypothetical protein
MKQTVKKRTVKYVLLLSGIVLVGIAAFMLLPAVPLKAQQASASPGTSQQVTGTPGSPDATTTIDGRYLPPPPQKFEGSIQLNADQSKPSWPMRIVPPKNAPNILLIMTDDVGFAAPRTPLFKRLTSRAFGKQSAVQVDQIAWEHFGLSSAHRAEPKNLAAETLSL